MCTQLPSEERYQIIRYSGVATSPLVHHIVLYACSKQPLKMGTYACTAPPPECSTFYAVRG